MYQLLYISSKINAINELPSSNMERNSFQNIKSDIEYKNTKYDHSKNMDRKINNTMDNKNRNMSYFEENIHLTPIL